MTDKKISALTAASTPLAGTEVLPIVQSGNTVKVAVSDLTAGRSVSASSLSLTTTPLAATSGGTGQSSYTIGDILYASSTTALSKLADVATGNALISGGVGVAPSWGKIGLTTHVSGTLPTANGGTNLTSFTANGVMYASSASVLATGSNLLFDGTTLNVGLSEYVGRLAATSGYAKTDTSERRTLSLRSTEALASYPLELFFALRGNATSANQAGVIQTGHYGLDFDALLCVNPNGGGVTIGDFTNPGSGNLRLGTGNLVVGTAGKGIDFSANTHAAGMTSELLNWYEEGTFTATLSAVTPPTTPPTTTAYYTRIGNLVTVTMDFSNVNTSGASGEAKVTGLPFTSKTGTYATGALFQINVLASVANGMVYMSPGTTQFNFIDSGATVNISAGTGRYLRLSFTYMV